MNRWSATLVAVLLCVSATGAPTVSSFEQANVNIKGRVTDVTGAPIAGVEIVVSYSDVKRISRRTTTGENGDFAISGLAAGRVAVRASLPGLRSDRKTVIIADTRDNAVDFAMTVAPLGNCPGDNCPSADTVQESSNAEHILSDIWQFSMQRAGVAFNPGNAQLRKEELRRQAITKQLHAIGEDAIPALVMALQDPDTLLRRNAVLILMDFAAGLTVEAQPALDIRIALPDLIGALDDSDESVRSWSAQTIGYIGPSAASAVSGLIRLLTREDEASRNGSCLALGQIGSAAAAALPTLRLALNDPHENVRRFARIAIEKIERR